MPSEHYDILTTSEAAMLAGVHESTIKRWCDTGTLLCTQTPGGHRRIGLDELLGFCERENLHRALVLFRPYAHTLWSGFQRIREEDDYTELEDLAYRWSCEGQSLSVQRLLQWLIAQGTSFGVLSDRLVRPLMYRVGAEWETGTVEAGAEHLFTNVILDSLCGLRLSFLSEGEAASNGRPVALVGCGPESLHEVGAHCVRIVLEQAGWQVVYLGGRVPVEDVAHLQQRLRASLVCLSLTPPHAPADFVRTARTLARLYHSDHPYSLALGGPVAPDPAALENEPLPFETLQVFEQITPFATWILSSLFQSVRISDS